MLKKIIKFLHPLDLILYPSNPFGLDISDYSIEAVLLKKKAEKPTLSAVGRTKIGSGIVEDGKILNKKDLISTLKNLTSNLQFGEIKTNKLIFSLPESKSFVHTFELPNNLAKNEIEELVQSQTAQTFPYPLTDLYLDFQIENNEVLLVASPKDIVDDYLELFEILKLQPIALEIESMSLARSLIREEKETVLIADIGARTTNFSLFDRKRLRLSISIPVAGNKFTQAISKELKIPFEKAENLKKEAGLNPEIKEGRIFLILQKEIQEIIKEMRKIDKYFQEKEKKPIEKIILAGGSAILPSLSEYLSANLEKRVEIPAPLTKINIDIVKKEYLKEKLEINPIFYSTVIGLALRGLEKDPKRAGINLIKDIKY